MKQIIKYLLITLLIFTPLLSVDFSVASGRNFTEMISVFPAPLTGGFIPKVDSEKYIVGAGDQFIVEKIQEQKVYIISVLPTGSLAIPGLKPIEVNGKTLNETMGVITEMAGEYFNISFYAAKKISVSVVGAVHTPGMYQVSASTRLSNLIQNIPLLSLGKDFEIEIIQKDTTIVVNIYNFYLRGDMESNPYIYENETIHIPFADVESECVQVYGKIIINDFNKRSASVKYLDTLATQGLVPLIKGETIGEFNRRKIQFGSEIDPKQIVIIRNDEQIILDQDEISTFILQAKDKIEYMSMKNISITGNINNPGLYDFIPIHTIQDYVSMAGGVNEKGSIKSIVVIRGNKKINKINNLEIKRGDIIFVKRSFDHIMIGEISVLGFITTLASITTALLTALLASGTI